MKQLSKQKFIRTLKATNKLWWYEKKIHDEIITIHNFKSFEDLFKHVTITGEVSYVDSYVQGFAKKYKLISHHYYKTK